MGNGLLGGSHFKYLGEYLLGLVELTDFRASAVGGLVAWIVSLAIGKPIPANILVLYGTFAVIWASYAVYRRERLWRAVTDDALFVTSHFVDPDRGFRAPAHHLIAFDGEFSFTAAATGSVPVRTIFLSVILESVEWRRPWWWIHRREYRTFLGTTFVQILEPQSDGTVTLTPPDGEWKVERARASWQFTDEIGLPFKGTLEAILQISTLSPRFGDYRTRIRPAYGSRVQGATG